MNASAYLTIDDSPTEDSLILCDFLSVHNIPAIFYCRGDHIEKHHNIAIEIIKRGFVLANHGYAHKRAINMTFNDITEDIIKCENLIERSYKKASISRPGKYYRFPYLDRGCGAWIVDFDQFKEPHKTAVHKLFAEGLYLDNAKPTSELTKKREQIQSWLRNEGFENPYKNINFPWYQHKQMSGAIDALYTFSTSDWMLTKRHLEKDHPFKSIEDLKDKIDNDEFLWSKYSHNIILIHDQTELTPVFKDLVFHMKERGLNFLPIE